MNNLILITSEFPYFSGEPFLLNELPYLSKSFNEIYIFSINGQSSENPTREIPENAICFPLDNTTSKSKYSKYIIKGIKKQHKDLQIQEKDPKKIVASLYTRGRAADITNRIIQIIDKNGLQVNEATIYSFWFAYQAVAAWLLAYRLKSKGIFTNCVSRAHGYDLYWERANGGYLPFQDASLRNLDYCFPCSSFGTDYLLEKYPWAKEKVITKRLGTRDYGINPYKGEKTLVTCCNLEPLKRITMFAEAFCIIAKKIPDLKWICIGSGEDEVKINTIITNEGMNKQVIMSGRLTNNRVMELYKTEGIMYFCNVSTSEGLPVSIMEAMSFGIPIIATDVGGTSELVDSDNGMLIPPHQDSVSLAELLYDSIEQNETRISEYRISSRKKWEKLCSAEVNYTSFCSTILDNRSLKIEEWIKDNGNKH